jgi:signal transduction histidine kinase
LAREVGDFDNILGVVFYDRSASLTTVSPSLQGRPLPEVDIQSVIATKVTLEGVLKDGVGRRYYRVEPIIGLTGDSIGAFLVIEDFPFFTRELRGRMLQTLLTLLMLFVVLSVIVSAVIRQSVTRPLQTFARRIEEIGDGQFNQRLQVSRRDEIGRFAQAFDRMCVRLDDSYRKLVNEGEEKLGLERALRHSERLAVVGQMAARLAHEIGTPLNVIQGRAEQLLSRHTIPEKDRAFIAVIVTQIERISGFIRQLLTLARRPEPQLRRVNVNEIVRRVWEMIGGQERTTGVEVVLRLTAEPPWILGDADQLQQVVLNLSVNAIQAAGNRGRVTLGTCAPVDGDPLSGRSIEVEVANTGPGIPPSDLPRLFEPFFTTKSLEGGTGLGLAICREIVLSHHGEIRVESGEDQGTRFIVSFPVTQTRPESTTPLTVHKKEQREGNGVA